jgi:hypothetical protein
MLARVPGRAATVIPKTTSDEPEYSANRRAHAPWMTVLKVTRKSRPSCRKDSVVCSEKVSSRST